MADVYAGDDALRGATPPSPASIRARFVVEADPDPDALPRIAALVAFANRAPCAGDLRVRADGGLVVTLEVDDAPAASAELIVRKLAQLTCVRRAVLETAVTPPPGG